MKKIKIIRGICSILIILCSLLIGLSIVAFQNEGPIDLALNVTEEVKKGGEVRYKSTYGELSNESLAELLADEDKFCQEQMEEGAVLLSNDGTLPLLKSGLKVSFFGRASADIIYESGSAGGEIDKKRLITLKTAFEEIGYELNPILYSAYESSTTKRIKGNLPNIGEEPIEFYTSEIINSFNSYKDAAIVVLSRDGGEGDDLTAIDSEGIRQLALHKNEKDMLNLIKNQGFNKIIVLLNSGYPLELDWLEEYSVNSCLWIGKPGLIGMRGVASIINGSVSPSGKTVDTYAKNSLSSPAMQNFGGFTFQNTSRNYYVYQEGIYVGYRYYETRYEDTILNQGNANSNVGSSTGSNWSYKDEISYPFGFGMSYTCFTQEIMDFEYQSDIDSFIIKVKVTNTGDFKGKDVVEVYVQTPYTEYDRTNKIEKSSVSLVGFSKTKELDKNEEEIVEISIDRYILASYDQLGAKGYILDEGTYYFAIGNNSHDAINNILAKKGKTMLDGMDYNGNPSKVKEYILDVNDDVVDRESYKNSKVTGNRVTNVFVGEYAIDINDFYDEDIVKYLSRSDWKNTYPTPIKDLVASEKLINSMNNVTYKKSSNSKKVEDFLQGVESNIDFVDLYEFDWDDERWDTFLNQLTIKELSYVCQNSFGTRAIESVNKPVNKDYDGPDGLANTYLFGSKGSATCYVCEMVSASSWNTDLLFKLGQFLGEDGLFCGTNLIYAPGVNIHRTPYSGRNFEYYSEDPILSYLLTAKECEGIQSKGLIAGPKHFCGNDQETNRSSCCLFLTEQNIREVYLKAFEGAFTKGGASATMSSIGCIGSKISTSSKALLTTVLRDEWGFMGLVTTDATVLPNSDETISAIISGVDYFSLSSKRAEIIEKYIIKNNDGDVLEALRLTNKRFYFTRAHSNLVNNLSKGILVTNNTSWWKVVIIIVDLIFGLMLISSVSFYIWLEIRTNKK